MSSNTNIGNTPVNQGYVQLIHTGETGGIDGTLRTLYDGDGTASDLQIASNKVKVSTELYIGSKTATEFIQDIVGDMFTTGSYTNITTTYDDTNGNIDLSASGEVTLTGTQTLTNKTLASPTFTGTANGDNLTLTGDLTVSGDTIFTNSNNVLIGDAILTLNADETGSPTANAGFEVERGTSTNKSFLWNETDDKWTIGSETFVAGTVEANLTGNVTGNVTGSASLNLLKSNNLSDLTNASTARTNLGVSIGSDVQAYDAGLQSISGLTTAADKMIYTTASDTYAVTSLTSTARTLLDDTSIGAMRTTLGLGLLATRDTVDFDRIDGTAYITSAEAFSDSDLQLMTAAAIDDLIVSKGYGTGNGDITAVNAGVGIGGGATSGDVDLTFEGSELPDMTDLMVSTDEFVVLDGTTSKRKAISEIRLTAFDDTGFSSGISFNGSTANGLLTYGNSTTADVESNLLFSGSTLEINNTGDWSSILNNTNSGGLRFGSKDSGGTLAYQIELSNTGNYVKLNEDVQLQATKKLYLDGGGNTYIDEPSGDQLRLVAGGTEVLKGYSSGAIDMYGGSTTSRSINIGANRSGNGYSWIDLVGDATYTDYGARFIRNNGGANTSSEIIHRGTGVLALKAYDAGSVRFYTSNTERVRIDSSGNMSIGGMAPAQKLHVNGRTRANSFDVVDSNAVIYRNSNQLEIVTYGGYNIDLNPAGDVRIDGASLKFNNNAEYIYFKDASGTSFRGMGINSGNNFYLGPIDSFAGGFMLYGASANTSGHVWYSGNAEAMRIDSSQRVGIGTNSPLEELDINGSLKVRGDSAAATEVLELGQFASPNGNTPQYTFNTYDSAGGLPSAGDHLEIRSVRWGQNISFSRNGQGGAVPTALFYNGSNQGYMELYRATNPTTDATYTTQVKLNVNGNSYLNGGNVGIGTTSPQRKLHVSTGDTSIAARFENTTSNGSVAEFISSGDSRTLTIQTDHIYSNGNLFFGLGNYTNTYRAGTHIFQEDTGNTEVMRITGQNVGIGTTSPDTRLDITSTGANGIVLNQQSSDSNTSSRLFFKQDDTTWNVYGSGGALMFNSGATVGSSSGTLKFQMKADGFRILDGALGVDVQPSTTDGRIDAGNDVVAFSTSDKRLKENIKPLDSALDKVLKINGVSFDWKELTEEEKKTIHGNEGHDVGVIAQEIEEVLPEVVTTRDSGYKAVKYEKIVPLLIEAIKELKTEIEELKNG